MIQISEIDALRRRIDEVRKAGHTIALVPTMGCLHKGHRALFDVARRQSDFVVVSIFVNPLQFGPSEDFDRYPRTPEADATLCRDGGIDILYTPDGATMYAPDHSVIVDETSLSRHLCGKHRPGHFRGVATVVTKLFNLVQPDIAVFGRKDAQQAAIIKRLVRDLNLPVRIITAPTVREPDGLAVSSRNRMLSPDTRRRAAVIHQALRAAVADYQRGEMDARRLCHGIASRIATQPSFSIEYVAAVDTETLEPVSRLRDNVLLAVAVHAEGIRLIDNEPLQHQAS